MRSAGETGIFKRIIGVIGDRANIALIIATSPDDTTADDIDTRLMGNGAVRFIASISTNAPIAINPPSQPLSNKPISRFCAQISRCGCRLFSAEHRWRACCGGAMRKAWRSVAWARRRRYLPEHMLAGGAQGPTPRMGNVTLAPGLGLSNRLVIDQGGASAR